MKKPNNIEDLKQCVKIIGKKLMIFCVECDKWKSAAILARSNVLLRQDGVKVVKDIDEEICVCSGCECDVEYLLSPTDRDFLLKSAA